MTHRVHVCLVRMGPFLLFIIGGCPRFAQHNKASSCYFVSFISAHQFSFRPEAFCSRPFETLERGTRLSVPGRRSIGHYLPDFMGNDPDL